MQFRTMVDERFPTASGFRFSNTTKYDSFMIYSNIPLIREERGGGSAGVVRQTGGVESVRDGGIDGVELQKDGVESERGDRTDGGGIDGVERQKDGVESERGDRTDGGGEIVGVYCVRRISHLLSL